MQIAESKGNAGKAGEWLVCTAVCMDKAKQTTPARETLQKALEISEVRSGSHSFRLGQGQLCDRSSLHCGHTLK